MSTDWLILMSNLQHITYKDPRMPAADERQLILDAQEGSHDAFRSLVERYMKQAYNIAYGVVNDHDDAEDIAQETFVRVHRSIHSFRGESEFSTWLYRITMNLSLNNVKRRKHASLDTMEQVENHMLDVGVRHDQSPQPDLQMHIERVLHELPTLQRATVILRHLNGFSTRQVSGILRCSESTVKTHLHRGLKKMRSRLGFLKADII
jgi:RNA polymerase sigma-70 factor (ECF subfamily)